MHPVVAFILVCLAGWLLVSALGRARGAAAQVRATTGRRSGIPRGGGGQRPLRHEIKLAWEKVQAQDWLAERAHERKLAAGGTAAAGTPATHPVSPLAAARQRLLARRASNGQAPVMVIPPAAQSRPVPPQAPSSSPPNGSPGRNTTMAASGSAVEQFVEGVNQIHAHAQAGGIRAKLEAVKAAHEACVRFSAMAQMLSRQMREPGMNYGNEITEPIGKAGVQLQASAMEFSEADAALTSLLSMTVGDLAQSSRQAPHHTELSEGGSR